jgi:(3,5-dihydroxyphenyl)acetyl-CoA 1,2-dioxygenase
MQPNFKNTPNAATLLGNAGLAANNVNSWIDAFPTLRSDFAYDGAACSMFWDLGKRLRRQLPKKSVRNPNETTANEYIHQGERELREHFLNAHIDKLYDKLTNCGSKFLRVEQLVIEAAQIIPGLVPSAEALAAERQLLLKDKEGIEVDHGILLSHVLAHPVFGRHLCHAMLLPRAETLDLLEYFAKHGLVDLGTATVSKVGKASVVELRNPKTLNALDETTLAPLETAIDLAILDKTTEIAILRGGTVEHPKYTGRRIFSAGINLTHLYQGKIAFLFYFQHAMGYENKMLRGIARNDASPDELAGSTTEKPWIAVVETFAIGGGCQHLLVMDYVLATDEAYLTLPARKEGIIPAMANLRLPRFVGDRLARQAIMYGRRINCNSPEGLLICDEVVPADQIDGALIQVVDNLTNSGIVSAVGNRRQFRIGQEPLDLFRQYLAVFAKEQAFCHFSSGLISNLERFWNAQSRTTTSKL